MAKKISIFWILVFSLLGAAIVPIGLLAFDSLSGSSVSIVQLIISVVVLVVVIIVAVVLFSRFVTAPLTKLSGAALHIEHLVDQETTGQLFSPDSLSEVRGADEVSSLVQPVSNMVMALQRRINEVTSISSMAQTITANYDYEETLQAVLTAVRQVVDSDAAEVTLLEDNRLVVQAWRGKENMNNTTGRVYKVGEGLTGMLAEARVLTYLASIDSVDLQSTLGYQAMTMQKELLTRTTKLVIRSFLGLPLMTGDRLVGTLTLVHHEPNYFTEEDKRRLNKLAEQASIAIENAVKIRERERQLQEQIKALQIEINESNKAQQIQEIVETDFFRDLQEKANSIRERRNMSASRRTQTLHAQDTVEVPSVPDSAKPESE